MCYFDKTGTLTSDRLNLMGVVTCDGREEHTSKGSASNGTQEVTSRTDPNAEDTFHPPEVIPAEASAVMAVCHELVWVNGKVGAGRGSDAQLVGNQMELIALQKSRWNFTATGVTTPPRWLRNGVGSLKTVYCFPFESANRRMTVVCKNEGSRQLRWARRGCMSCSVFMKGAPEMVEQFLARVPPNYTSTFKKYTLEGKRVISLAWKDLPESVAEKDVGVPCAVKGS